VGKPLVPRTGNATLLGRRCRVLTTDRVQGLVGGLGREERLRAFPVVLGDEGEVRVVHGTGLVVPGSGRMVAVIGIDDVVVVDTPDALLVTTRSRAQEVKRIVAALKETGRQDLT
jgi:mannose-1-phosphate guanylyltransferase